MPDQATVTGLDSRPESADGVTLSVKPVPNFNKSEEISRADNRDLELESFGESISKDVQKTVDPFGSEENAQVKYKTMRWWYVRAQGPLALVRF